jgi:hypothetical protein
MMKRKRHWRKSRTKGEKRGIFPAKGFQGSKEKGLIVRTKG